MPRIVFFFSAEWQGGVIWTLEEQQVGRTDRWPHLERTSLKAAAHDPPPDCLAALAIPALDWVWA